MIGLIEVAWGLALLILLAGAAAAGVYIQARLKEAHRAQTTVDAVRSIAGMVVTFAAIVLGLLVTSTKADFDQHTQIYRHYGISLIQLDLRLREYGTADVAPIRRQLRAYTAVVIVVTWPQEPRPSGDYPTDLRPVTPGSDETAVLTELAAHIDDEIERLSPPDAYHRKLAALLQDDIRRVGADRWTLVERSQSKLEPIFFGVMMFWLAAAFVIFGVTSPPNKLTYFVVGLSALAVASSLYLVLDLDSSLAGFIQVPSQPIRDALWHMDHDSGF